jgi:energy-coupling factor transport system ATP-binding protein
LPPDRALAGRGLTVRFTGAARAALDGIDIDLAAGTVLGVLGPSGSGKSTLIAALLGVIPELVPATAGGTVAWGDGAFAPPSLAAGRAAAAVVQQDPDGALVALAVADEIAFGLESDGLPAAEIDARVAAALASGPAAGLLPDAETLALSGGWRQRLAWAAALALRRPVLLLDEPFAHLDPQAASVASDAIRTARAAGTATLLVEHRADLVAGLADQLLVLDGTGRPLLRGPAAQVLAEAAERPGACGLRLPAAVLVAAALRRAGLLSPQARPADAAALLSALGPLRHEPAVAAETARALGIQPRTTTAPGAVRVALEGAAVRRGGATILSGVDLTVRDGTILGIAGSNGAGKTTLGLLLAGGLRPSAGQRRAPPGPAPLVVPQNPALAFASGSLREEARRRGVDWTAAATRIAAAGLPADPDRNPLRFSQGERRRLAVALAAAGGASRLILLDEPQAGLDGPSLAALTADLFALRRDGHAVVVVAHDLDWLASLADDLAILAAGRIALAGPAAEVVGRILDGTAPVSVPPGVALAAALGVMPLRGAA